MDNEESKNEKKTVNNKNINAKLNKEINKFEKKDLKYNVRLDDVNTQISEIKKIINEKSKQSDNPNVTELESKLEKLSEKKEKLILAQKDNKRRLNKLYKKKESLSKPITLIKTGIKNTAKTSINIVKGTTSNVAKATFNKVNPLDKKIDKNDISETGMESLRISYMTAKRTHATIKTAKKTIKTTKNTIKTTKNTIKTTGKVVKTTAKVTYKVASFTIKAAVTVVKTTVSATVHVIAAIMNPVVLIILACVLVIVICASAVITLMGGGAAASNATKYAVSNPVGLGDVPEGWNDGIEFLNTSKEKKKNEFANIIDNLYYDVNDATHSDLVYMERTDQSGSKTIYNKSFAVESQKNTLKSSLDWNLSLTELEVLSITYVYLQKIENKKNETTDAVYSVNFTQEIIDEIVGKLVMFSDNTYPNQECPGKSCTKHVETKPNPEFENAKYLTENYLSAYNDWIIIVDLIYDNNAIRDGRGQTAHWNNNIQWRIDNWNSVYTHATPYYSNNGEDFLNLLYKWYSDQWDYTYSLPETIEVVTYNCEHLHTLHSLGLSFFSKNDIMNSLNFSENEIKWEELTEGGFQVATTSEG